MSLWLVAAVGLTYFIVGLMEFKAGAPWWGIVWTGYAAAQIGLIWARLQGLQ